MRDDLIQRLMIGIMILLFIFWGITLLLFNSGGENVVEKRDTDESIFLEQYRGMNISEECRIPSYENSLDSWMQHLSHHKNTLYCLEEYYW